MENKFENLLADVISSITQEEHALCQANINRPIHANDNINTRRTMIAYDELVKSS
jgi:hypothetical protein